MNPISVCLCTYKRPELLKDCLDSLLSQNYSGEFEVVIVDNDSHQSARQVVSCLESKFKSNNIGLKYLCEPEQNIALARNKAVANASYEHIAFIDDDEAAASGWLDSLASGLTQFGSDGVFGPVQPLFPITFPKWLINSPLFKTARHENGKTLRGDQCATNNALVKKEVLRMRPGPFDQAIGRIGGSDVDLFQWLAVEFNSQWRWVQNAGVCERQEERRSHLRWHLVRAYRRGWMYAHQRYRQWGQWGALGRSLLQVPVSLAGCLLVSLRSLANPRGAGLNLLVGLAGNVGKIGYFFGVRVKEYVARKENRDGGSGTE